MNSDVADKIFSCCQSQEAKLAKQKSDEIDRRILEEVKNRRPEFKLLLLGPGGSGKSTFLKQMRILHGEGFPEEERRTFVQAIYHNLCIAIQTLVRNMKNLNIEYTNSDNIIRAHNFAEAVFSFQGEVSPEYVQDCSILWADPGIRECYARRNDFYIMESAMYFLPRIDVVIDPEYTPTIQDILHARVPTSGIHEFSFTLDDLIFRFIEVRGETGDRMKWIHCFEIVNSIIFFADVSEFDQVLLEEETVNRWEECKALFQEMISSYWFQRTEMVLFLNKRDLFLEKIAYLDLNHYFTDYHGAIHDPIDARKFILDTFQNLNPDPGKLIFTHFTCATDTECIQHTFNILRDTIVYRDLLNFKLA